MPAFTRKFNAPRPTPLNLHPLHSLTPPPPSPPPAPSPPKIPSCLLMYIYMYVFVYLHIYICMYICKYIYVYVKIYIPNYACLLSCSCVQNGHYPPLQFHPLSLSPPLSPTLSRRLFVPLTQTHTQRRSWRILQSSAQQATTQRRPAAIHCATLAATTNLSTAQCHEAARQHISCVTSSVTTVRVYICMYGGGWVCGQVCIIQICIYIHIHSPQRCLCMHTDTYLNAYILPPEAEHTHMQHLMQQQ